MGDKTVRDQLQGSAISLPAHTIANESVVITGGEETLKGGNGGRPFCIEAGRSAACYDRKARFPVSGNERASIVREWR